MLTPLLFSLFLVLVSEDGRCRGFRHRSPATPVSHTTRLFGRRGGYDQVCHLPPYPSPSSSLSPIPRHRSCLLLFLYLPLSPCLCLSLSLSLSTPLSLPVSLCLSRSLSTPLSLPDSVFLESERVGLGEVLPWSLCDGGSWSQSPGRDSPQRGLGRQRRRWPVSPDGSRRHRLTPLVEPSPDCNSTTNTATGVPEKDQSKTRPSSSSPTGRYGAG